MATWKTHEKDGNGHTFFLCFAFFRPGCASVNTLRPRQNGRHFPDDIFKCIFLNENIWISIKISLKFVYKGPINNISALVQIMAWRRPGDKPLSEPMMVNLPTHICVTRPKWVKVCVGCNHFLRFHHHSDDIFFQRPLLLTRFKFDPTMDK